MELSINLFKQALHQGKPQIGLWVGLADSYVTELLATTGFDCLVVDAEHAPNDPRSVLPQLQAMARASRWNQIKDYLPRSDAERCLFVQVESVNATADFEAIAAVEGVDGVFFGPADLAASTGLLGQPADPKVQAAVLKGITTVISAGKVAGTLTADRSLARKYLGQGALFVAVGADATLLVKAATALAAEFTHASRGANQ